MDLFGNEQMLAITLKQPYASLMLQGKDETRTWPTNYRGLVLLCSGRQPYPYEEIVKISGDVQLSRLWEALSYAQFKDLPAGKAIAVGNLISCRRMTPADENKTFVAYKNGLYCHIYANVRPIVPFDWKGVQGWKKVDQKTINQIKYL